MDEVIETIPGIHVAAYRFTYGPIYTIRGMYSRYNPQVLMLINGIPISKLELGSRGWNWAGMSLAAVERIEVIRGPGSAVYGADAFAGDINVITKSKIKGTVGGSRVGSFDTEDVWALHGGNYGGFNVALTLEYHSTDGHDEIIEEDAQTYFDKNSEKKFL